MGDIKLAVIAFLISLGVTPFVRKLAFKIGAVDVPKEARKIHNKPMPRMGGFAIFIAFVLGLVISKGAITTTERGIIIGATVIVIGGILDDVMDLKPKSKLAFQVLAAVILILHGIYINSITNPFSSLSYGFININIFAIPMTIIWVVGVTNALNLIDGLDGLAAGVGFIASVTIYMVAILAERNSVATLTAILAGSILGFLPYNFNPASIFMGDTGSQLLGFLLAAISMEGAVKSATTFVIVVPILALGLPIYDTLFAVIRRKVNGKSIMEADRGHLHHRLLDLGLSQRQSVIIMYLISACLGAIAILAMEISTKKAYFLLVSVIVLIAGVAWKMGFFKKSI